MGVTIPRDADQQFRQGAPVEAAPQPGDLIYFGEHDPDQPNSRYASIDHVAISLGGDEVLHATSSAGGILLNSLNPNTPITAHCCVKTWLGEEVRMKLTWEPYTLDLRHNWRIAHGASDQRHNVLAQIGGGEEAGIGEAAG